MTNPNPHEVDVSLTYGHCDVCHKYHPVHRSGRLHLCIACWLRRFAEVAA